MRISQCKVRQVNDLAVINMALVCPISHQHWLSHIKSVPTRQQSPEYPEGYPESCLLRLTFWNPSMQAHCASFCRFYFQILVPRLAWLPGIRTGCPYIAIVLCDDCWWAQREIEGYTLCGRDLVSGLLAAMKIRTKVEEQLMALDLYFGYLVVPLVVGYYLVSTLVKARLKTYISHLPWTFLFDADKRPGDLTVTLRNFKVSQRSYMNGSGLTLYSDQFSVASSDYLLSAVDTPFPEPRTLIRLLSYP